MKKRNHILFGLAISFIFILLLGWLKLNWIAFGIFSILNIVLVVVFYSLLPDIDHKNSTITWWFFGIGVLGLVAGMILMAFRINNPNPYSLLIFSTLLLVFTFLATNLFEHRGLMHSVPVGILACIPAGFLFHSFIYSVFAYVAWHSHLLGDGYLFKIK